MHKGIRSLESEVLKEWIQNGKLVNRGYFPLLTDMQDLHNYFLLKKGIFCVSMATVILV